MTGIDEARLWWRITDRHGTVHLAHAADEVGTVLCGYTRLRTTHASQADDWPDDSMLCAACALLASADRQATLLTSWR